MAITLEGQEEIIRRIKPDLCKNLKCHPEFLAILDSKSVLSRYEIEELQSEKNGITRAYLLCNIIPTRVNGINVLAEALRNTQQTGALDILSQEVTRRKNGQTIDLNNNREIQLNNTTQNHTDKNGNVKRFRFLIKEKEKHLAVGMCGGGKDVFSLCGAIMWSRPFSSCHSTDITVYSSPTSNYSSSIALLRMYNLFQGILFTFKLYRLYYAQISWKYVPRRILPNCSRPCICTTVDFVDPPITHKSHEASNDSPDMYLNKAYEVLSLSFGATQDQVDHAYQQKSKLYNNHENGNGTSNERDSLLYQQSINAFYMIVSWKSEDEKSFSSVRVRFELLDSELTLLK